MNNVKEYKVVKASQVNELIQQGWQPWGSPMKNGAQFDQAVVRFEEAPQPDFTAAPPAAIIDPTAEPKKKTTTRRKKSVPVKTD